MSAPRRRLQSVAVFCGSSLGASPAYADAARALARECASRGIDVVYGGARVGVMGALADEALAHGARVYGVIPQTLVDREVAHTGLTELEIVTTMHARKESMARRSDAFIALPGGLGTLEEIFEVWTWSYLGIHGKPLGFLDTARFYEPLFAMLAHVRAEAFVPPHILALAHRHEDPSALLDLLSS